ncbi:hypothetical protein AC579_3294 [Pseudocercospora musae]|uniref:54S ribosomal protein L31, mitochondrial n=1 Tax=Pseudocercospora musae TaxID=113226 RepID=A0A139I9P7_9PEZI|nr:hypothetical protein AC579_3294 [Pseudocercospora musae]
MFGAFRPTAPLSGGLLWKIPWRISRHQKARHRQRLRRVDNIVSVLDNALQRQAGISAQQSTRTQQTAQVPHPEGVEGQATPEELSHTAEGLRMLARDTNKDVAQRRHGKGAKQGDYVPEQNPVGIEVPGKRLLRDVAAEHGTTKLIERWKAEMPTEGEMLAKDKYTMFDKKVRGYRKGVHKLPKWTRVSQRLNPPGF